MNRGIKLLILFLVLCLTGGGAWYALGHLQEEPAEEPEPAAAAEDETFKAFGLEKESITAFSWTCLNRSAGVTREGDAWVFTDENGEKQTADQNIMDVLLGELADVQAKRKLENVAQTTGYGFEDPICEIHVEADGKTYDLVFGDPAKSDDECYYFMCGDGNVYLTPGTMQSDFFYRPQDLLPGSK